MNLYLFVMLIISPFGGFVNTERRQHPRIKRTKWGFIPFVRRGGFYIRPYETNKNGIEAGRRGRRPLQYHVESNENKSMD